MRKSTKLRRVAVKEEFVVLTGDLEKGIMLNQFIYWSERIYDFDNFIEEERTRAEGHGLDEVNIEAQNGWIYKDMPELKEEIMFTSSISTMSRKLNDLVKSGWIDRRNNPRYKWDKRYQYRVNLNKISKDLFEIGYILPDYRVDIAELLKSPNLQNESTVLHSESSDLHGDRAISEIKTFIHSPNLSTEEKEDFIDNIKENERVNENSTVNEFNQILKNSSYDDFEEEYSTAIEQSIRILYYSDKPLAINGMRVPCGQVREDLQRLRWEHLALRDFKIASERQQINNVTAYLSRCIYNAIFNSGLKVEADLRYNGLI